MTERSQAEPVIGDSIQYYFGPYDSQFLVGGEALAMALEGWCFACNSRVEQIALTGPRNNPTPITRCPCCLYQFQIVNQTSELRRYRLHSLPFVVSCKDRMDDPICEHRDRAGLPL